MNLLLFQKKRLSKGISLALDFMGGTLDSRISFSRGSNATVVGSNGLIQYAPHNLLTYSEQFDNAAWNKNASIVITANANTAPDGTMTADEFSGSLVNCGVWRVPTTTASIPHIYSIYLKNVNNATNLLVGCDANPANAFIRFNSVTGEITSVAGNVTSSSVIAIGNGWYRVTVGFVPTTTLPTFVLYSTSGASATWLVWGAQLNQGELQPYYSTTVKNLLGYSQNFENAAWTKISSSIAASTVIGPFGFDGGQKLVENTVNNLHYVAQTQSTSAKSVLTLSIYAKAGERTQVDVRVGGIGWATSPVCVVNLITGAIVSGSGATVVPVGDGWFRISLTAIADGTTQARGIVVAPAVAGNSTYTGDGTSGIYIFGAQLSDSASLDTYSYNPVAAPTSTAYYGPRFDYDPETLAPKGLLIEEQRTNLLTYSSEFENTAWTKTNATVSANVTIAPDGTLTADKLEPATTASTSIYQSVVIAASSYTGSVYVKKGSGASDANRFYLRDSTTSTTLLQVAIDYDTLVITYVIGSTGASVQNVGNGWLRVSLTITSSLTIGNTLRYGVCFVGNNETAGEFAYAWGAQLEAGAFPTSYIPTTSATVTRAADNASMVGSNFSSWYNQSEGTIYSQWMLGGDNISANVYNINDTTSANYIRNRYNSAGTANDNAVTASNIVQQTLTATNQIALYAMYKNAMAYKQNDFVRSANGTLITGSTGNTPVVSQMNIGASESSVNQLNGHIQAIKYYPTRLPNADLQRLTR